MNIKKVKLKSFLGIENVKIYRHRFSTNSINVVILKQNKNVWVSFPLVLCSMGGTYLCVAIGGLLATAAVSGLQW